MCNLVSEHGDAEVGLLLSERGQTLGGVGGEDGEEGEYCTVHQSWETLQPLSVHRYRGEVGGGRRWGREEVGGGRRWGEGGGGGRWGEGGREEGRGKTVHLCIVVAIPYFG